MNKIVLERYINTARLFYNQNLDNLELMNNESNSFDLINLNEEFLNILSYKLSLHLFEFINILLVLIEKNLYLEINEFFLKLNE